MPADHPCFNLPTAAATTRLGQLAAELAHPGDVLLLEGSVGAGKTHFARAFIQARLARLDLREDVPSPTFTLVQTYEADCEIWHADLYRLNHPDELCELGLEEAFDQAICLIEWPDRLGDLVPQKALTLRFDVIDAGKSRRVCPTGPGTLAKRLQEAWQG